MKQEYPKWMFHASEPARIVHDEAEKKALGKGWEETPAAFLRESPAGAPKTAPGATSGGDDGPQAPPKSEAPRAAQTAKTGKGGKK